MWGLPLLSTEAQLLRVDFNDGNSSTTSGWESYSRLDTEANSPWSKTFTGGISLITTAFGNVSLDDRDRGNQNGGGAEAAMWRDFLFANGSISNNPNSGLNLNFSGLTPNQEYPITIWAYDSGSTSGRAADWSDGGAATARLIFDGASPSTLDDYRIIINATADATGNLQLTGRVSASNPNLSHNVFINGLEIGTPLSSSAPTDLTLTSSDVSQFAAPGTVVGSFQTTDSTPGNTFSYSLVSGLGSEDNGIFEINGNNLQVIGSLSAFQVGSFLAVRVRTTAALGGFFEKSFQIEINNDSDLDDLNDSWELAFFRNLTSATADGDNDQDGLINRDEFANGTDPTSPDTDNDSITDGQEVNSLGTNPNLADSDADGILDPDELSVANGFVTDAISFDTDGDGYNDLVEINQGTDPTDQNNFPSSTIPLRLNEILARNITGIDDGFGDRGDWIEIFNPNAQAINLAGYYLTDNDTDLTKWDFPSVTIAGNSYLVVFATGLDVVDPQGNPHTNFSLSGGGEYLAIVQPDGSTIDDQITPEYPPQFRDISYGIPSGGGARAFFQDRTPGQINSSDTFPGVVRDTSFLTDRGFYDSPFLLTITSPTPGATIRYTLDGSKPSTTNGFIYNNPVPINTTTTVRAIATFNQWLPTNVDTHTYLFIEDVVTQPADPAGWPSDWGFDSEVGQVVVSDYEMDPRVVNNTNGLGVFTVQEALRDIPTVAISLKQEDASGGVNGLYTNPRGRFEHECSIEYILEDGTTGFQEDCIIETQGNSSRRPFRMQKHSMRLTFRSAVGISKLRFPLFDDSDVDEFNQLVLRACFTDSWGLNTWAPQRYRPNDSLYIRDVWMKDMQTKMGHAAGHGNFVHLYVNGLYFGVHNFTERIADDWFADHLGGEEEDWLINDNLVTPPARWDQMMNLANGNITSNSVYQNVLNFIDMENYIDYMLLHFYADAEDWPRANGYAAANVASGDGRFRFAVWDQEIALDNFDWDRYDDGRGAGEPLQRFRLNEEFRMLFADRTQKHLFNGGALTQQSSGDLFLSIANEIDKAIVAESARWGDTQDNTPYGMTPGNEFGIFDDAYPPTANDPVYFTREQNWLVELNHVIDNHLPVIHDDTNADGIINELRAENLFPSIDAPIFAQHGGIVPANTDLIVTAEEGTIYATTDGSDPRLIGGGINPDATILISNEVTEELISFGETQWRYIAETAPTTVTQSTSDIVVGNSNYNSNDWKHPSFDHSSWTQGQAMLGFGTITGRTITQQIPPATPRALTTYFRKEFNVTNASTFSRLELDIIRDDGAIVYLNGREIDRSNILPGTIGNDDTAINADPEGEVVRLQTFNLSPGFLVEGMNVIAVELHQTSSGSSDLGLDLRVLGLRSNNLDGFITLTATGPLKARTLSNGEWSALTEAEFIVGNTALPSSLVISEIYYNPDGPDSGNEWIELMNISDQSVDLTNVSLIGVNYSFSSGTILGAGERLVIVEDQTIFNDNYNTSGINIAPGQFTGSLSNDGEELGLIDANGMDLLRFTYEVVEPWPTSPDGDGPSLTLIAPLSRPNLNVPESWRASFNIGGTPGTREGSLFTGNPTADADGDGLSALAEYALGSINGDAGSSPESLVNLASDSFDGGTTQQLTISHRRNISANDVLIVVEISDDLLSWDTVGVTLTSVIPNSDGTEQVNYRLDESFDTLDRQFVRLRLQTESQ